MSNTGVVLRKNANILKYLHKANPFIRDYIIRNSHKELVTCFQICEQITLVEFQSPLALDSFYSLQHVISIGPKQTLFLIHL